MCKETVVGIIVYHSKTQGAILISTDYGLCVSWRSCILCADVNQFHKVLLNSAQAGMCVVLPFVLKCVYSYVCALTVRIGKTCESWYSDCL